MTVLASQPSVSIDTDTKFPRLRALMAYEGRPLPETPDIEKDLLEIVHPPRLKTLLPGRLGLRAKSDEVQGLAVDVLGSIGGLRSVPVLLHLAEEPEDRRRQSRFRLGEDGLEFGFVGMGLDGLFQQELPNGLDDLHARYHYEPEEG